ncbi:MAG TPA: M14 family zinc carboxypeptidase, partial [Calditrichia bacterium]|nr:M14 family zinc carboxypeptidase [Calditrichia bacterium]
MKRFFIISLLMLLWLPLPGEESAPQILVHLSGLTGEEGDRLADIGLTIPGLPAPEQTLLVSAGQLLQLRELGIPARVLPRPESEANILRPGYMDVAAIEALSDSLVGAFPNLVRKEVYGISVEGRELFALKISDNVHRDENEPEVGFDGCHHGDEALSAEVLMRMVRQMCLAYGKDAYLSSLIDEREIWVFPVVNPDGRETLDRRNARGVDLNRDWGYMWDAWGGSNTPYSQPETRAALSWLLDHQFAVLQSLHAGMEMISYPWSYSPHDSPDHQAIESLAQGYVNNSHYPELSHGPGFKNLYPINGNAKDSYYGIRGALGWTMELGAEKMPPAERINHFYDKNLPAMLHLIDAAGLGISGTVRSSLTGLPLAATVWVSRAGEDFWPVYSDPENGAFHKYLAPGNYRVRVSANGYLSASGEEIVVGERGAAHRDFYLEEGGGFFAHQVLACRIPGNNHADNGLTYQTLGEPDGRGYSLGRAG